MAPAEARHTMRFRSPAQRQARCVAHLLAAQAADRLGHSGPPAVLARRDHGRPVLPGIDLDVSISHAPGLTVCAAGRGCRVGVDVEPRRAMRLEDIAAALTAAELALAHTGRLPASLLACWTAKEAVLKAHGGGFAPGLGSENLFAGEPVLHGTRWCVSRHEFEHDTVAYLCTLAVDRPGAAIMTGWGVLSAGP
jgi:phosphopantetheinyl transferase